MIGIGHHGVAGRFLPREAATMLMRRVTSTQYNLQDSYSVKCGVGIAAIWIVFYAVIGLAGMVVQGISSVAALH